MTHPLRAFSEGILDGLSGRNVRLRDTALSPSTKWYPKRVCRRQGDIEAGQTPHRNDRLQRILAFGLFAGEGPGSVRQRPSARVARMAAIGS